MKLTNQISTYKIQITIGDVLTPVVAAVTSNNKEQTIAGLTLDTGLKLDCSALLHDEYISKQVINQVKNSILLDQIVKEMNQ